MGASAGFVSRKIRDRKISLILLTHNKITHPVSVRAVCIILFVVGSGILQ